MSIFDSWLCSFLNVVFVYVRPFIKWFLHRFTRLCELQRLCYGAQAGAPRTNKVEKSLRLSKNLAIQKLIQELDNLADVCDESEVQQFPRRAVHVVMKAKDIKEHCHPDFGMLFGDCVLQIWSYRRLVNAVERLRSEPYNAENLDHEKKLLQLWQCLMPKEPLQNRVTKQWQEIGFQGDDPKTDFRGMGMLGLENLLYFAMEYHDAAQHVLSHSNHPTLGYTFAIVGINLTALAYRLLKSGDAKVHFYNLAHSERKACLMKHFHEFYCYLFFEFDRFWMESEPNNIMDFREIYQSFEITVLEALHNEKTVFKPNLLIEKV